MSELFMFKESASGDLRHTQNTIKASPVQASFTQCSTIHYLSGTVQVKMPNWIKLALTKVKLTTPPINGSAKHFHAVFLIYRSCLTSSGFVQNAKYCTLSRPVIEM